MVWQITARATTVKSQANSMDTYSRRDNIIIYGIKEPAYESSTLCEKAVTTFFSDQLGFTDAEVYAIRFVICHRINERKTRKPIIVRFVSYFDRERVWS